MSFKFKSVGKKEKKIDVNINPIYYGTKFPFELDDKYTFLKINTIPLDQLTDDLKSLILTNYGERVGRYDYGANLKPLLAEVSNQSFETSASQNIVSAVTKWMPFVSLLDLKTKVNSDATYGLSVLELMITFSIPTVSEEIRILNFTINLLG